MNQITTKLKAAHKSVFVWFNGLFASLALGFPYLLEAFPQMQSYLPTNVYKYGMTIIIIGNILLHFRPTQREGDK